MKEEQSSIPPTHSCLHPCIFQESRGPDPMLPTGFNAGLLDSLGGDNSRPGSRNFAHCSYSSFTRRSVK